MSNNQPPCPHDQATDDAKEVGKGTIETETETEIEIEDTAVVVMVLPEVAEVEVVALGIGIVGAGRTVVLGVHHQEEMTESGEVVQVSLFILYILCVLIFYAIDRRDYNRDDDRRDRREDTRRGERRDYDRDDRRDHDRDGTREKERRRDGHHRGDRPREPDSKLEKGRAEEREMRDQSPRQSASNCPSKLIYLLTSHESEAVAPAPSAPSTSRPNLDPDAPDDMGEDGEEMDVVNEEDAAMASIMGLSGFGTTKVGTPA